MLFFLELLLSIKDGENFFNLFYYLLNMFHQLGWTTSWNQDLDSPVDCQEIKPVNPKGNQFWIFIGRTDTEAPVVWPPDVKSQLIGKDPDAGKGWRQKKRAAEDQMVGWHHWLNGHEFEQTLGDNEGQRSLACWKSMGS